MYNAVCCTHAGTLPWRFGVHCEMTKETNSSSQRIYTIFTFFLFLHAQIAGGQCRSTWCRTGANAYQRLQVQPGLQKRNRPRPHMHAPSSLDHQQLVNEKKKYMTCCAHAQPKTMKRFSVARQQRFFFKVLEGDEQELISLSFHSADEN